MKESQVSHFKVSVVADAVADADADAVSVSRYLIDGH